MVNKLARPVTGSIVTAKVPADPPAVGVFVMGLVLSQQKSQVKVRVLDVVALNATTSDPPTEAVRAIRKGEEVFLPNNQLISVFHPRRRESIKSPSRLIVKLYCGMVADIFLVGEGDPIEARFIRADECREGRTRCCEDLMVTEKGLEQISVKRK